MNNSFNFHNTACTNYIEKFDNIRHFNKHFRNNYDSVIAYHATKLSKENKQAIKTSGLECSSLKLLTSIANERFIMPEDPEELKNQIEKEIIYNLKINYPYDKSELNFGLYKDDLIESYNHYLLFGAEGLLILADHLKNKFGISFRNRAFKFGNPYIVMVKVETSLIDDMWIDGIYNYWMHNDHETSLVIDFNIAPKDIIQIKQIPIPLIGNHSIF